MVNMTYQTEYYISCNPGMNMIMDMIFGKKNRSIENDRVKIEIWGVFPCNRDAVVMEQLSQKLLFVQSFNSFNSSNLRFRQQLINFIHIPAFSRIPPSLCKSANLALFIFAGDDPCQLTSTSLEIVQHYSTEPVLHVKLLIVDKDKRGEGLCQPSSQSRTLSR